MNATYTHPTTPRPWWLELILVDIRHALWPWLAYLVACGVFAYLPQSLTERDSPYEWILVNVIILFAVPAIVTAIFTADFGHSTIQNLLTFPRQRSRVWLLRMLLLTGLIALPLIIAIIAASATPGHPIMIIYGMFLAQVLYCFITFGPMYAVMFRKTLLSWSAIVIAPVVVATASLMLQNALGVEDPKTLAQEFPYLPPFTFWFIIIAGIPAALFAWSQWQRLELRS